MKTLEPTLTQTSEPTLTLTLVPTLMLGLTLGPTQEPTLEPMDLQQVQQQENATQIAELDTEVLPAPHTPTSHQMVNGTDQQPT